MSKADFEKMREAMVDSQLRTSGVNEPWVMAAMGNMPREDFVAPDKASICYMDRAIEIGEGRVLNPPLTTGLMLQEVEPNASDNALLIGSGCGYVAAFLAQRVERLTLLEEEKALAKQTNAKLGKQPGITMVEGPLNAGATDGAPYDLIWIDGAIETLPQVIVDQLADGGRIVTGQLDGPVSRLAMGIKRGGEVALRAFADADIAPFPGFAEKKEFAF